MNRFQIDVKCAALNPDVQWLRGNFVSHEAVDLFRIKVIDLAVQNRLPRSVQQSIQAFTYGLQPEIIISMIFLQLNQSSHNDQVVS